MTATTPNTASAQPSLLRIAKILGAAALVAGLWAHCGASVGAGVTVGVFIVWGACRSFEG
jgi:hypothetical protein